jgi:hypothetical protein
MQAHLKTSGEAGNNDNGKALIPPAGRQAEETTQAKPEAVAVPMTCFACSYGAFSVVFFVLPVAFVSFSAKVFHKSVCFSIPETARHAAFFA